MNKSISTNEYNKRKKFFLKKYLKWSLSNKNKPAPIYPPELTNNNVDNDEWEYEKGEELILDNKKKKGNKDKIIHKLTDFYKKRKLDKIKDGELWNGFN
jgi:hypothetical protein